VIGALAAILFGCGLGQFFGSIGTTGFSVTVGCGFVLSLIFVAGACKLLSTYCCQEQNAIKETMQAARSWTDRAIKGDLDNICRLDNDALLARKCVESLTQAGIPSDLYTRLIVCGNQIAGSLRYLMKMV
jgi:hypothetical protein